MPARKASIIHVNGQAIGLGDIQTSRDFCERNPDLWTLTEFQWLIARREKNGLAASGAITKRADQWWVVTPLMLGWLMSEQAATVGGKTQ